MPATRKNNSGGLDNGGFRAPPKRWQDMPLVGPSKFVGDEWVTVTVPVYTKGPQAIYAKDARGAAVQAKMLARMYSAQGDAVAATLCSLLGSMSGDPFARARVEHATLTRLSPGFLDPHDGLPGSQKHVVDMLCAWILMGRKCLSMDRAAIGDCDGHVLWNPDAKTGMVTWRYAQEKTQRLYGVRIALKLKALSTRSTTPTNQPSSSTEPLEK